MACYRFLRLALSDVLGARVILVGPTIALVSAQSIISFPISGREGEREGGRKSVGVLQWFRRYSSLFCLVCGPKLMYSDVWRIPKNSARTNLQPCPLTFCKTVQHP